MNQGLAIQDANAAGLESSTPQQHPRAHDLRTGVVRSSRRAPISDQLLCGSPDELSRLYLVAFGDRPVTMEPGLADLETKAAEYVRRIADSKRFDLGDPMERTTLACFIAVQMIRTRAVLETQANMMSPDEDVA